MGQGVDFATDLTHTEQVNHRETNALLRHGTRHHHR